MFNASEGSCTFRLGADGEPGSRYPKALAKPGGWSRRLSPPAPRRDVRVGRKHSGGHLHEAPHGASSFGDRAAAALGSTPGLASRAERHNLGYTMTLPQILDRIPTGEPGPPPAMPEADRTPPVRFPFDNTYARLPERFF